MFEEIRQRRLRKREARPAPPTSSQRWIAFLSILVCVILQHMLQNDFRASFALAGLVDLAVVVWAACWGGLRPALAGCLGIVGYVYMVYRYPGLTHFPYHRDRETQALLSAVIIYPLFAIFAALIQTRMREGAIREFDARAAAEVAQAELWASEEMRKLIVNASVDAVLGLSDDGTITLWNPNAERLFGWTQWEAVGANMREKIVPVRLRNEYDQGMRKLLETGQGPMLRTLTEQIAVTKAGEEVAVELYLADQKTESGTVFICFVRDISERKRAEKAIQELNSSLEERVTERTAQLEAVNNELIGFTYSVSHDLRAPLRAIVSNSRIVCEEAKDSLSEEMCERLRRLEISALKMSELIENLLKFARMGQVELSFREVDLTSLAQGIAEELRAVRGGRFEVQPGLKTFGDPDMLKIVLFNLMENAAKYTKPREEPEVEVGSDVPNEFYVRDKGIGFDMQYAHKIWEPFERLHRDTQYPGTGIGLANSKRIVNRHGGRIWAESAPGVGTTVFFELAGVPSPLEIPGNRQLV